jgi:hypothetical protein
MTTYYQNSKTNVIDANKCQRSLVGRFTNHFLVVVNHIDTEGNFAPEPLKNRGYEFGGINMSVVGRKWFKGFDSEAAADAEIAVLCEVGI